MGLLTLGVHKKVPNAINKVSLLPTKAGHPQGSDRNGDLRGLWRSRYRDTLEQSRGCIEKRPCQDMSRIFLMLELSKMRFSKSANIQARTILSYSTSGTMVSQP